MEKRQYLLLLLFGLRKRSLCQNYTFENSGMILGKFVYYLATPMVSKLMLHITPVCVKALVPIEQAFTRLKRRWEILHQEVRVPIKKSIQIGGYIPYSIPLFGHLFRYQTLPFGKNSSASAENNIIIH